MKKYDKVYYIIKYNYNFIISQKVKNAICNIREKDLNIPTQIGEEVKTDLTDNIGLLIRKWSDSSFYSSYSAKIIYKSRAWYDRNKIIDAKFHGDFIGTIQEIISEIKNSIHDKPRTVKGSLNTITELDLVYDEEEYKRLIWEE